MLKWFLAVDDICAEMEKEARDAIEYFEDHDALETEPSEDKVEGFKKTLTAHLKRLKADWPDDIGPNRINDLTRHIGFSERHDFSDMVHLDIPSIRGAAREYAGKTDAAPQPVGFENLLHPLIVSVSVSHFQDGDYRNAVLDGVLAVFDLIRERSGFREDGKALIGKVFSLNDPHLVFSEIRTDSGRNEQKGFMQILEGAYQALRNARAHTLKHDLTDRDAAQYLVMLSILAERVENAVDLSHL